MAANLSIEEFNALLNSTQESPLLTSLRELTTETPEELAGTEGTLFSWLGWDF